MDCDDIRFMPKEAQEAAKAQAKKEYLQKRYEEGPTQEEIELFNNWIEAAENFTDKLSSRTKQILSYQNIYQLDELNFYTLCYKRYKSDCSHLRRIKGLKYSDSEFLEIYQKALAAGYNTFKIPMHKYLNITKPKLSLKRFMNWLYYNEKAQPYTICFFIAFYLALYFIFGGR